MYGNVVVGIGGLPGDRDAVALAKALAPAGDRFALANVRVVEAVPSRGSSGAFDAAERELSRELLQRERGAVAPDAEIVSVVATSVGGGLHEVAESRGADLIVVGSCHRSVVGRIFAGDDARSVLHHAPCAVGLAPAGYADGTTRPAVIAAAYDGSHASEVALAHAALLAAELGAKLVARYVVQPHVYGAGAWIAAPAVFEDPQSVAGAARERLGDLHGVELEVIVGPVRDALVALSDEVDVLVCGSRHQSAVQRVMLGSTSDYLARHSACAMVVTPATDEQRVAAWHELRGATAV